MNEKIVENARAGRGLWIGLFPVAGTTVDGVGRIQTDPHVTLAHLGRDNTQDTVLRALAALATVRQLYAPFDCKSNGFARFIGGGREGNPIVVLLRGGNLRRVYESTTMELSDRCVKYDRSFDFLPHITLGRTTQAEVFAAPSPQIIRFDRVGLVCGDAREYRTLEREDVF